MSSDHSRISLEQVEQQIHDVSTVLADKSRRLYFPNHWEQEYLQARDQRFIDVDIKVIVGGFLVYVLFGWADFMLGGSSGASIFAARALITCVLLLGLFALPKSPWRSLIVPVTAIGIALVGLSIIVFSFFLEGSSRYAYHLGLIPVQVFAMVSLRLSYRAMLASSVIMLGAYVATIPFLGSFFDSEIDQILSVMMPLFVLFWLLLIVMGAFLAYAIESAGRSDFLKNRLLALEAQRLHYLTERLHHLSTTDPLTGLANRRHFEVCFDEEWRRALRQKHSLALLMVDVDHFKRYNDRYGHQQGDDCLIAVTECLASFCRRAGDVCARFGGEEFIMLFPDMDLTDASILADEIRQRIEGLAITHEGNESSVVTVSIGVAAGVVQAHQHPEELVRCADRLLYDAKEAGRNQVKSGLLN